ncbi:MAG: hypothetical protein AAFN27_17410 [Pseudomonadota bacterium]
MTMHEADIRRLTGGKERRGDGELHVLGDESLQPIKGRLSRTEALAARAWGEPEDDDA